MPYKETDKADHQVSLRYKRVTENIAHTIHLFGLPITMPFFTVYGPGASRHGPI